MNKICHLPSLGDQNISILLSCRTSLPFVGLKRDLSVVKFTGDPEFCTGASGVVNGASVLMSIQVPSIIRYVPGFYHSYLPPANEVAAR